MRHVVGFFLVLFTAALVSAQTYIAGQTYYGRRSYVEYRAGNLPLIITSGHGGDLQPAEIPERSYGTKVKDTNTRELAIACYDEIVRRTGRYPHLVISHLHRDRLDPNREIVEAAQGNTYAEQAWNEFHGFIATAREAARAAYGFGHVVDLHGHGHSIARLELGYALGADELNVSDTALNNPGYAWMSTLRTLALARPGLPFPDLLRGPRSLGSLFVDRDVPAWPSSTWPSPGSASFFNGGYIVRQHSCILDNDTVHGVQIETNYSGVRDSASSRSSFAATFSQVMQPWLYDNYGYSLGTLSLYSLKSPSSLRLERGGSPLTITIAREGYIAFSSTLDVSPGGTAIAGDDYTISTQSLNFASGQSSATLVITPAPVGPATGDKTISVALAPNLKQSADTAPLSLVIGDGVSQTVRVEPLAATVSEADRLARFRVIRTQATTAMTVPLVWSGTALDLSDYRDAPQEISFTVGQTQTEFSVALIDDGRPEPDKILTVSIQASPSYRTGLPASASITLRDDDRPANLAVWLRGDLSGNRAWDSSGNDRHATTLPAVGASVAGPVAGANGSIDFDGVDDTVALPRFTIDQDGAFTIALHFKLRAGGAISAQNLASLGTRGETGSLHLYLATINSANGTVALRTHLPDLASNALDVSLTAPATWQDDSWHHYALSVSADGSVAVYVDGVLRKTATGRTSRLAATELLWLGWRPASGASAAFMSGAMRDVRVYSRALTSAEISSAASGRLTFSAWLSGNGLPSNIAAGDDPDGNGAPALLEYALAAAPERTPPSTELSLHDGRLAISFLRESLASDLIWQIEATSDLADAWHALARRVSGDAGWTILTAGADVTETNDHVTATDAVPFSARRFLRVRVSVAL